MYNSPINIIYGQMQTQMEGDILRAVQQYDINVDKEELIRALRYDRDQYDRGFADGYMDAKQELVTCGNCKYLEYGRCRFWNAEIHPDNYCSWGEDKNKDLSLQLRFEVVKVVKLSFFTISSPIGTYIEKVIGKK